MTDQITDAQIAGWLKDFTLLLGMERDLPPTTPLGHKRLEMLVAGERAIRDIMVSFAATVKRTPGIRGRKW